VIYRLGDPHRLRLTLATVRQTVTGPRRRLAPTPFLTARHVWLHTDPPLDLDVDGEIRGRTPAQITLEANALRVIGPGARLLGFFGSSSGDRQLPALLARSSA
jgi:diacylglycerol kinase (ATP)